MLVVSLLLLASCVPASAPPTIKVGLVAPFSGRDAAAGYNMLYAAKLALKEWNDRGGVGGYGIELVAQDDRNEAEMGAVQARKMALDSQVMGVVGHPSRESALAATPVYREAGLPVLVTGAAVPEQDGGPPVFQLGPTESELAQETVRFAVAQGARRLAILGKAPPLTSAQQIYPVQGLAQLVERAALGNGPVVVWSGAPTPGRDNEARIIEDLKVNRPDLVFYGGGYVEGGSLLARMRAQGLGAAFLGGPGLAKPDLLKIAGTAAEGVYYLSIAPHPSDAPEARGFVDAFRALAGTEPWPEALLTYDAMNDMLETLSLASKEGKHPGRAVLRQGLLQGRYQGRSGLIAFDGQGNRIGARGYIYRVEGMAWPGRLLR